MRESTERLIRQATSVALAAATVLIGLGVAGLDPSIPLAVGAAGLAGLLFSVRQSMAALADLEPLAVHSETLWIGPALAAAVLLLFGDLTPGELQTVGALVGLAGMTNYLLRPVYVTVASLVGRLTRIAA